MEGKFHDLLLKHSVNETNKFGGLNAILDFQDKKNYLTEDDGKKEIAYYFPLRNEKNAEFLKTHLKYLEEESSKQDMIQYNHSMDFLVLKCKIRNLNKDILIFKSRITQLKSHLLEIAKGYKDMIESHWMSETMGWNIRSKRLLMNQIA